MIFEVVCAGPGIFRWMGLDMIGEPRMAWHLIREMEYTVGQKLTALNFCCGARLTPDPNRAAPIEHKECFVDLDGRPGCPACVAYIKSQMIDEATVGL